MAHDTKKADDRCKGNYPSTNLWWFWWAVRNTNSTVPLCSYTDTLIIYIYTYTHTLFETLAYSDF